MNIEYVPASAIEPGDAIGSGSHFMTVESVSRRQDLIGILTPDCFYICHENERIPRQESPLATARHEEASI